MYKILTVGLAALNAFFLLSLPLQAQTIDTEANSKCNAALLDAKRRIEVGRNVTIQIQSFDVSKIYENYPAKHPLGYWLTLQGSASSSIMNSPQLSKAMSKNIITKCESVSLVQFGVARTDWIRAFGLVDSSRVEAFKCIEPGIGSRRLRWGYIVCP